MNDSELLQHFLRTRNERTLGSLISRYLDFVYGVAHRLAQGDLHVAQDVTAQVFVDLAAKADRVVAHPSLPVWLYASARFNALTVVRDEQRSPGAEAAAPLARVRGEANATAELIRPLVDDALGDLADRDQQLLILHCFVRQPVAIVGAQLGLTDVAAQKAINRALESLGAALTRRGVPVAAGQLAPALESMTHPAPTAVATAIVASVTATVLGPNRAAPSLAIPWLRWAALVVAVAAALGVGWRLGSTRSTGADARVPQAQDEQHRRELETLRQQVQEANKRATAAEADASALLAAIEQAKSMLGTLPSTTASSGDASVLPAAATTPGAEPATPQIVVMGQVAYPARLVFAEGMNLQAAIDKAGGFRELAKRDAVRILRRRSDGTTRVITVDTNAGGGTFQLEPRDVIYVPERIL